MPYNDLTIDLDPVAQNNSLIGGDHAAYWPLPSRRYNRNNYKFSARRFTPEPDPASYVDTGNNLLATGDPSVVESWNAVAGTVRSTRRENIVFPSEDFTSTRYVKSGATVALGDVVGGKQFTRFIPNAGTGAKILSQLLTIEAKTYDRWFTNQLVVKSDGANTTRFALQARDSQGIRGYVYFRLAAGTVSAATSTYYGSLTPLGDGYFLATMSVLVRAGSTQAFFALYASNPALDATTNFNFNGTDAYLVSAFQTELGREATDYIKSVDGPAVDPGFPGYLSNALTLFKSTDTSGGAVGVQTAGPSSLAVGERYNVHAIVKKGTMEKSVLLATVSGSLPGGPYSRTAAVSFDFNTKEVLDLSDGSSNFITTLERGALDLPGGWLLVYFKFQAPAGNPTVNTTLVAGSGVPAEPTGRYFYADHIHVEKNDGVLPIGYSDGTKSVKGTVAYFHGSGTTEFLSTDHPIVTGLTGKGYDVLQILDLGYGTSSPTPFRYGYGNVNAPHFASHFMKTAIHVEAMYKYLLDNTTTPFVFLGQSRGAAAAMAWAARQLGRDNYSTRCKGVVACGGTVAGLGNFTWNDMNRNINTMSGIIAELRLPTIVACGDKDQYAPPNYCRRLQLSSPASPGVYFVSPGDTDHYWLRDPNFAPLAIMWAEQLFNEVPVTERDGVTFATRGAAVPLIIANPADTGGTGGVTAAVNAQAAVAGFWPDSSSDDDPEILYYKNPKSLIQPASTTKMLSVLTALRIAEERGVPHSQSFTITGFDITAGSGNNLQVGDIITFSELMVNMLLPSSNTSATALARNIGRFIIGSGTEPSASYNAFIEEMNKQAASVGMIRSRFMNPHGLAATGQLVTARDLMMLVRAASKSPTIASIWKQPNATLHILGPNARNIPVENTNQFLSAPDWEGGKTGTLGSIYNLGSYFKTVNGGFLAVAVLHSTSADRRYTDTRNIVDAVNATLI